MIYRRHNEPHQVRHRKHTRMWHSVSDLQQSFTHASQPMFAETSCSLPVSFQKNLRCHTHPDAVPSSPSLPMMASAPRSRRCTTCNAFCCVYAEQEHIVNAYNFLPSQDEKYKAAMLKAEIGKWMPLGMDDTTFQQCSGCGDYFCPSCCGICPIDVCGALCCKVSRRARGMEGCCERGECADGDDRSASCSHGHHARVRPHAHSRMGAMGSLNGATSFEGGLQLRMHM